MFPMFMRLRVASADRKPFRLWFPVILVWIILFALMILVFPFVLLAALITWRRGPGRMLLWSYPLLIAVLWRLSGLHIETKDARNELLIDFQ